MSGALRLRREDNSIAAFALLDGGSGNEVVTGSVRYGELMRPQLPTACSCTPMVESEGIDLYVWLYGRYAFAAWRVTVVCVSETG